LFCNDRLHHLSRFGIAETNRAPFDLPEAEPELVGGYHPNTSSFKFALFFLSEYANMITSSAIIATLYLGGWHFRTWRRSRCRRLLLSFCRSVPSRSKSGSFYSFNQWVRWSLPRFRYDQLMNLGWKVCCRCRCSTSSPPVLFCYSFARWKGVEPCPRIHAAMHTSSASGKSVHSRNPQSMKLTLEQMLKKKDTASIGRALGSSGGVSRRTCSFWKRMASNVALPAVVLTRCPRLRSKFRRRDGTEKERYPSLFEINMLRCIFCGFCEEVCPEERSS